MQLLGNADARRADLRAGYFFSEASQISMILGSSDSK